MPTFGLVLESWDTILRIDSYKCNDIILIGLDDKIALCQTEAIWIVFKVTIKCCGKMEMNYLNA